jgi:acetyltransferase-like isoleucine patch superfamily enzyme
MGEKIVLCKAIPGAMTEQEKAEAGYLYNPNTTSEMAAWRFRIQDAICQYNTMKPSDVEGRRNFLAKIFGKIGKKCNILPPFKCDYGFHIEVGENFFANYNFIVLDGNYVRIGNNVWIAPNVGIYAAGHPLDMEDRIAGWEYAHPVTIGDNVWIGGSVSIIGGVTIGENSVVAAGSVVVRDVPPNTLVAGNPARVIRTITKADKLKYAHAPCDIGK